MKRAPTKKRLALILDKQGNVTGIADGGRSFHAIEMLEEGLDETEPVTVQDEDSPELVSLLDELGVTDVVAAWLEEDSFGAFEGEGMSLWLVPAETSRAEAIERWHENTLTRAEAGVEVRSKGHVLHAPKIEEHPSA